MLRRLNSTQIENASVDAVSGYFNFSETLAPNIPKNDKEPVWDGKLFLYKSGSDKQSKTGLIGFIPVQVKGRQFKDFSNRKIKYPIEVNDIKIYQANGGVAFFVVYINAETEETKIYYRLLAPIELRKIAKIAGNKKQISIEFCELSKRSKTIELQFLDFYNDCQKQHSVSNQEPIFFKDVENDIDSIKINFTSTTNNHFEALQQFTASSHFCYVTLKSDPTKTPHPLGDGRINFNAQSSADIPVIVNGKQYFDKIELDVVTGKVFIKIGGCLRIPFTSNPEDVGKRETVSVNVNFRSLAERLRNYAFLLALRENPIIDIGGRLFKIEKTSFEDTVEIIHEIDQNLQSVFTQLHVTEDLDITKVKDGEYKIIKTLIDHYVYSKRVIPENDVDHKFIRLEIGNIVLMFLAEKVENPNLYKLHSVHDLSNFVFSTKNDLGNFVLMPPFVAFNTETFRDVCNISFEKFIEQCEQWRSNDNRFYQAVNWSILRMLNAFDQQTFKKHILIETALKLNQWLIDNDPDSNSSIIHLINRLQTVKRIKGLSKQEENMLFDYIENPYSNDELRFACYTLLENKSRATMYLNKFLPETQEFYKTLPIYNLYNVLT